MGNFKLNYRTLLRDEKIILFGMGAKDILAVKALDVENYLSLFEALYNGEDVYLPEFNTDQPVAIYCYCDAPVGSTTFSCGSHSSYKANPNRMVYNVPASYATYEVNNFLLPFVHKAMSLVSDKVTDITSANAFSALSLQYQPLTDTILAGMFLYVYKTKLVNVCSYAAIRNTFASHDGYSLRGTSLASLSLKELQEIYSYLHFNMPEEVLFSALMGDMPVIPNELIVNPEMYINKIKTKSLLIGDSLFNFCLKNSIVISSGFVSLNGFTYFNNTIYTAIDRVTGTSPFSPASSATLSNFVHNLMVSITSAGQPSQSVLSNLGNLFSLKSNGSYAYANGQSFIFLNSDHLTTSKITRACGVSELVELDKDFLDAIKETYEDATANLLASDSETALKNRKTEFAHRKESVVSEAEVWNKRYVTVTNADNKLLILAKTSLAKEAAKKMAITRKISAAVSPVIDMAIRLFAMRDLTCGVTNTRFLFPITGKECLGYSGSAEDKLTSTEWLLAANLKSDFETRVAEVIKDSSLSISKIATGLVSGLYKTQLYSGSPFFGCLQAPSNCRGNFYHFGNDAKKQQVLNVVIRHFSQLFDTKYDSAKATSDLFSPSSGSLDLYRLATSLYRSTQSATFEPGFEFLKNISYGYSLSGKQLHFLYTNNFIELDETFSNEVAKHKSQDYVYLTNPNVVASSGFRFSQEALDTFVTLKKSKSFTDYGEWFKGVKDSLHTINKDTFEVVDYPLYKVINIFLNYCESMFTELAKVENPYLPKPEVKVRASKKASIEAAVLASLAKHQAEAETKSEQTGETDEHAGNNEQPEVCS